MLKQLANAQVKLERAQQNAEEKRAQSQQTLERLQEEYEKMLEIEEAKVCPSMHQTRGHLADLLLRRSLASSATHCL